MRIIENELHEFYPRLIQTPLVTMGIDAASPVSPFKGLHKLKTFII